MIQRAIRISLVFLVLTPLVAWAALALWFDSGAPSQIAFGLSAGVIALAGTAFFLVRPFYRAFLCVLGLFLLVLVWWWQIEPSATRNWMTDVAELSTADIRGDLVTIHNVRNFDYSGPQTFTPHWEDRNYDLSKIVGIDLFLSYWGSPWIAHTIVSWEFENGSHLAISIETRKEQGEDYSALKGFFRQYELYYVVADERDVIRVRTKYRGETVYLYRVKEDPVYARALLLDYLSEINRLAGKPKWYNAFTHNCTTSIRKHRQSIGRAKPWDWRILVNGYIDELGYANGSIDNSLPFAELKQRSMVNDRANADDALENFSARIRTH